MGKHSLRHLAPIALMAREVSILSPSSRSLFDAQVVMSERSDDIETLARMAARVAGRDPDEHGTLKLGGMVIFQGPLWRYPDFLTRAETAYEALIAPRLVRPHDLNGHSAPTEGAALAAVSSSRRDQV
jgi:hypothetical protein